MRASLIASILASLLLLLLVAACDRDVDDDEPTLQERVRAPDEEMSNLVVTGGDLRITVDDVEEAVHRLRLLAPGVADGKIPDEEPEWMKAPQAQINLVRNLTYFHVVRLAAAERDLTVSDDEIRAFIADHDPLKRYLPLFETDTEADTDELREELAAVDLDASDIAYLAEDMVLADRLKDLLAAEFTEERLWAIYQQAHDEADLVVVRMHNTPTSQEIDEAMERLDAEIRAHYRENRREFRTPRRVLVTLLRANDGDADPDLLETVAARLADDDPEEIADEFDLTVTQGVDVTRHENPRAHASTVGDTGVVPRSRRGAYAWRVDEIIDPQTRSLDRPLRRQIASGLLRNVEGITPSTRVRAQQARDIMREIDADGPLTEPQIDALVTRLEEADFETFHTDIFSLRGPAVIPHIGLAEQVMAAVSELDLDGDAPPVTEPVLDRNRIYVARLVARNHPNRDVFDAEKEEFREQFITRNRDRFVDQFVNEYHDRHGVDFYLPPLVERFGRIDKKPGQHTEPPTELDPIVEDLPSPEELPPGP